MTEVEYRIDPEEAVAAAIDAAEETGDPVADEVSEKPRLLVDKSNPDDDEIGYCVEGASGLPYVVRVDNLILLIQRGSHCAAQT